MVAEFGEKDSNICFMHAEVISVLAVVNIAGATVNDVNMLIAAAVKMANGNAFN